MDANDTSVNPFGDWNFVWFAYCDGSSHSSNRDLHKPLVYNNTNLYFRGQAILDANLDELQVMGRFLSEATEVIVGGTSAGGLASIYHSSYIKSKLQNPRASLVAAPDAGFFFDHISYSGEYIW